MLKLFAVLLAVLLFTCQPLSAETVRIQPDLTIELDLPGEEWKLSRQAPLFLEESTAEHLEHELEAAGKRVDSAKLQELAARRLSANEAFVYNPATGAVLTIDFSPLRDGESTPGRRALAASARYAAEGLADEEGFAEVTQQTAKIEVAGARYAYRIDARYRHHGEPTKFVGIVGFVSPYWFYLYYTDPLKDPRDAAAMDRVLKSLVVAPAAGK